MYLFCHLKIDKHINYKMSINILLKPIITCNICPFLELCDIASFNVAYRIGKQIYRHVAYAHIKNHEIVQHLQANCKHLSKLNIDVYLTNHEYDMLSMCPIKHVTFNGSFQNCHVNVFKHLKYLEINNDYEYDIGNETMERMKELQIDMLDPNSYNFHCNKGYMLYKQASNIHLRLSNDSICELSMLRKIEKEFGEQIRIIGADISDIHDGMVDYLREHRSITYLQIFDTHTDIVDISSLCILPLKKMRLRRVNIPLSFNNSNLTSLYLSNIGKYPEITLPRLTSLHLVDLSIDLRLLSGSPIRELMLDHCDCDFDRLPNLPLRKLIVSSQGRMKGKFRRFHTSKITKFKLDYLSITGNKLINDKSIKYLPTSLYELDIYAEITCETIMLPNLHILSVTSENVTDKGVANIAKMQLTELTLLCGNLSSRAKHIINTMNIRPDKLDLLED